LKAHRYFPTRHLLSSTPYLLPFGHKSSAWRSQLTDLFGFVVLIVFGIKGQGHRRQRPGKQGECFIFELFELISPKLGLRHTDYVKRSKSRSCGHHIYHTNEGNFTQFWSQMYLHM